MTAKIRVKLTGRMRVGQHPAYWLSLFKNGIPELGDCEFVLDLDSRDYDWLVVVEDLMQFENGAPSNRIEKLACPREHTLLITQEPPAIKIYGPAFLAQYGHILSSQPRAAIDHESHILEQAPIRWFYGRPLGQHDKYASVDYLSALGPINKPRNISTVCSNKVMTPLHKQRFEFTQSLAAALGNDLDWFGRGVRPINDKSEAMDDYRYHIAIENDIYPHHWTEKIADSYLAYCLPLYFGPDNITDYFPAEAVLPIDIFDLDKSIEIMRRAIADDVYKSALPAICRARELIISDYNLVNVIARHVTRLHQPELKAKSGDEIMGRHIFRKRHPIKAMQDVMYRSRLKKTLS